MIDPASLSLDDYYGPAPSDLQPGDAYIVVTQSCDLLNQGSQAEPSFEVLLARKQSAVQAQFSLGKHPRSYSLACSCSGNHAYSVGVKDRAFLRREALFACKLLDCTISKRQAKTLAFWHGRRYFRSGFPTEFDRRLKAKKKALLAILKEKGQAISGIYFGLNTERELGPEEVYSVSVAITVAPEDWEESAIRSDASRVATELEAILGTCEGVDVSGCEAFPSTEVDLYTIESSMRFDEFDFLSEDDPD